MIEIVKERIKEDYYRIGGIVDNLPISNEEKCNVLEAVDLLCKDIKSNVVMEDNSKILESVEFDR